MTRFAIVGTGWRARFFLRLARQLPDRLQVSGVVARTAARAEQIAAEWGVATYVSVADLMAHETPDYVVVSVPWEVTPVVTADLVERGVRVLAETPPAPDADGLRALWARVGASGLVQVAEQYLLMPSHAARLAVVRSGVLGQVTSVQLSSTHMYHAVSLIRGYLGVTFEPAEVTARVFTAPLVDPLSGGGWTGHDTPRPVRTTIATVDFGDSRMGLYDFTDNQWWNPLRARRLVIRGSRGELVDDSVVRLVDPTTPVRSDLIRRQTGLDLSLEGLDLKHISFDGTVVYRSPYVGSGLSDDDIAVVAILEEAGAWARDEGPEPYPLALACQDHLIALAMDDSARANASVRTGREAWAE
jgi:predicted dehydrogenase